MKRLVIIPARGGSKRIRRKNIRPFLGIPIILRVLNSISSAECFDEIHVSTDDQEIFEVVSDAGYKPAFMRPNHLADDYVGLKDVLRDVVATYLDAGIRFDTVIMVFATAVLLDPSTLKDAIVKFEKIKAIQVEMLSVARYDVPIEWAMHMDENGFLKAICPESLLIRSQDLMPTWHETAEFVIYSGLMLSQNDAGDFRRVGYPVRHKTVDIDTEDDWRYAEKIYQLK